MSTGDVLILKLFEAYSDMLMKPMFYAWHEHDGVLRDVTKGLYVMEIFKEFCHSSRGRMKSCFSLMILS